MTDTPDTPTDEHTCRFCTDGTRYYPPINGFGRGVTSCCPFCLGTRKQYPINMFVADAQAVLAESEIESRTNAGEFSQQRQPRD